MRHRARKAVRRIRAGRGAGLAVRIPIGVLSAAGLATTLSAYALPSLASAPDPAAELQRRQQRERELRKELEPSPDVRLLQPAPPLGALPIPKDESPCFVVSRIALTGRDAERFGHALKAVQEGDDPALGRCLGTQGINVVLARVQNAIIAKGYVTTRILAAPQDLSSGELALTVIPGRIRDIRFAPDAGPRGSYRSALPARPGDVLNLRDIEQGLENFKRTPTADADFQIVPAEGPGAGPGESDIVIRYRQAFPLRLTLSADDAGSKATGKYQGGVTLSADSPLALYDLFYLGYNHDLGGGDAGKRGARGYTAHYSVPYGYWLLGFTASDYRYHQSVAGINQTYIYSGESRNGEIKLSRLVHRDAVRKTTVSLLGWARTSKNYIDDVEIEIQRRRTGGWGAGLGHREFLGTAALDLGLGYRQGTGAFDSLPAPEEAFGEGTSRMRIVTADARFGVPFRLGAQSLRYGAALRAQWQRTPLVPQDRFAIGGRYTVRGFDGETLLSADRGWLIRNDLGLNLGGSGTELYLGLDYGEVGGPSSRLLPGTRLAGAVVGWRGQFERLNFDVFAGTPVSRPDGFRSPSTVLGFNLNWTL